MKFDASVLKKEFDKNTLFSFKTNFKYTMAFILRQYVVVHLIVFCNRA